MIIKRKKKVQFEKRRRPFQKLNPLSPPLGLPLPQIVKNNWNIFDLGYNNTSCFSTLVSILSTNCYTLPHVARICHCSFLSLVSELLDKDWEFNLAVSFFAPPRLPPPPPIFFFFVFPFLPRSLYIFPENTAWVRTGTVNGPLISFHRLNSGHFGDRKAKGEGERGREKRVGRSWGRGNPGLLMDLMLRDSAHWSPG